MSLRPFIQHLISLLGFDEDYQCISEPDPRCNKIIYPIQLLKALEDLDQLIGMTKTKDEVVAQLKYLIFNGNKGFGSYMLNSVIYGPPGCGKTELGKILSRVWRSIGFLQHESKSDNCESCIKHKMKALKYQIKLDRINNISTVSKKCVKSMANNHLICKPSSKRKQLAWVKNGFKYAILGNNVVDIESESDITFIDRIPIEIGKESVEDEPYVIASRSHFVAAYLGQTAIKTEKFLNENKGKVVFIDEAYSLLNNERDSFGMEALTSLNKHMSEHPETPIIFAGYKDLMQEGIFSAQPGLERRCVWTLTVDGYDDDELRKIYLFQLKKQQYVVEESINLKEFFRTNKNIFTSYGGDTAKLVFYNDILYSQKKFDDDSVDDRIISKDIIERSLEMLKENKLSKETSKPPPIYL